MKPISTNSTIIKNQPSRSIISFPYGNGVDSASDVGASLFTNKGEKMKAKNNEAYTPAPWVDFGVGIIGTEDKLKVITDYHNDNECRPSTPEEQANARLIAASPMLLEACEEALHELRIRCGYKGDEHCYIALKQALARATGADGDA